MEKIFFNNKKGFFPINPHFLHFYYVTNYKATVIISSQPKCPLGGDKIKINQNLRHTLKILHVYHMLLFLVIEML